jgi:hypothetical protein
MFAASDRLFEAFQELQEKLVENEDQETTNVPDDLEAQIKTKMKENPDITWHRAVRLTVDPDARAERRRRRERQRRRGLERHRRMTDAPTIKPGDRLHGVEVLSLDPLGKRAIVSCGCGQTHLVGVEALVAGQVICPAAKSSGKWRP